MKIFTTVLGISMAAGILAAVLTGCGSDSSAASPDTDGELGSTEVIHIPVDGQQVTCVVWDGYNAGGISCNWNAK